MEITINRLQLKNLRNSEYARFVHQMVEIFDKYDPETLHLQKAFGKLLNVLPVLDKVKAQELSNELSDSLEELDAERDTLIKGIAAQVKMMGKLSISGVAPHVAVMKRFLDIHGHDIASANYNSATERTIKLLADYDAKPDVIAAVEALHLKILFDQLSVVNTQFDNLYVQRTEEEGDKEKVDSRAIRTETDKVLTAFFNAFEFCSTEYDEPDFTTPANRLNELIDLYKTQLKARVTRRNSGKDAGKEPPVA